MKRRTLSLKRETLTDLVPEDLRAVVGAGAECGDATCPHVYCVVLTVIHSCDIAC